MGNVTPQESTIEAKFLRRSGELELEAQQALEVSRQQLADATKKLQAPPGGEEPRDRR